MAKQHYKNHVRYYPPHHFIFYPVLLVLLGFSTFFAFKDTAQRAVWIFISLALFMVGYVSFMLRQHYGLGNQNRIVRLEMRLRYYVLTHQRFESIEPHFSFGQIAALRFAPDDELPSLVERALSEKLTPDEIKQKIVNWLPDEMRL
jgi:hypothetical protein